MSVTPFWTVALKMVRYNPVDREDICILLRSGTQSRQLHWTPTLLETWLLGTCWGTLLMDYGLPTTYVSISSDGLFWV